MSKSVYSEYKNPSDYGVGENSQDDELFKKLLGARDNRLYSFSNADTSEFLSNAGAMEFTPEPKANPIYLSALSQGVVKNYPSSQLHTEKLLALEALRTIPDRENYFNKEIPFVDNLPYPSSINRWNKIPLADRVDKMKNELGNIQRVLDKNNAKIRIVQEREPCSSDQFNCKNVFLPGFLPKENKLFHITEYGSWIEDEKKRQQENAQTSRDAYNNLWDKFYKQPNQSQSIQSPKNKFSSPITNVNKQIEKSVVQFWSPDSERSSTSDYRESPKIAPEKIINKPIISKDFTSRKRRLESTVQERSSPTKQSSIRHDKQDLRSRFYGYKKQLSIGEKNLREALRKDTNISSIRKESSSEKKFSESISYTDIDSSYDPLAEDSSSDSDSEFRSLFYGRHEYQNIFYGKDEHQNQSNQFQQEIFDSVEAENQRRQENQNRINRIREQNNMMQEEAERAQEMEDLLFEL